MGRAVITQIFHRVAENYNLQHSEGPQLINEDTERFLKHTMDLPEFIIGWHSFKNIYYEDATVRSYLSQPMLFIVLDAD